MSSPALHIVDAFADRPFSGNPAAVCLLEGPAEPAWMQALAVEMNLSETAFVHPEAGGFRLRWFTPGTEVALCGHATLATAHALWDTGTLPPASEARFETRSGTLRCRRHGAEIEMDFPGIPSERGCPPPEVSACLGRTVSEGWRVPREKIGEPTWLIDLDSEAAVRELRPRLDAIRCPEAPCLIVTAKASAPGIDFVSRFFGPAVGVDEDPVTGAAHCALAPWWAERLGRRILTGYQASRRGGLVGMELAGDRVRLRGQAVTVLRGTLDSWRPLT